jgi:hypothetical protein
MAFFFLYKSVWSELDALVLTFTLFFPLLVSLSRDLNQPPEPLECCSLFFMLLMRVSVAAVDLLLARCGMGLALGVAILCLMGR